MSIFIYLVTFAISSASADNHNPCNEIPFVTCSSFLPDINGSVTVVQPLIMFEGGYRPVAHANPSKYDPKRTFEQVEAWVDSQKKILCKALNLGDPLRITTGDAWGNVIGLELKLVDGKVRAVENAQAGYIRSITCSPKTETLENKPTF